MSLGIDSILLTAALDRVIPPVDDFPGAGEMGLSGEVINRCGADFRFSEAIRVVVDLLPAANDFMKLDGEAQDEALRAVELSHPDYFGLWLDVIYTIYYMQPEVHVRLNWHGRSPQPDGNSMPPWDDSVLNVVRARDPFWRKT